MALGIPGSILGQLIGYESSSYANKRADWQVIWDITLTPQMEGLDNAINKAFLDKQHPEFRGIDEIYSDLSSIAALQEDVDALQERARKNKDAGILGWHESRIAVGLDPDPDPDEIFMVPANMQAIPYRELGQAPEPAATPAEAVAAQFRQAFLAKDVTPKVGRRPLLADPSARATYEEAEALRERHPGLTYAQVASRVGISERQYRTYRSKFGTAE
jgi:hypothetical protein